MKIGIICNLKDKNLDSEYSEEFDTIETIQAITEILTKHGHDAVHLEANPKIAQLALENKIDFAINLAEGYFGRSRESQIPALLEMLNIPYSGSDPITLGLALDKVLAKRVAKHCKVPTPNYSVVKNKEDLAGIDNKLKYPLITKPCWEGSSKGIYNRSRSTALGELEENIKHLWSKYPHQPILVEEYIKGREITVGIIGNSNPQVLGIMEIANKNATADDFFYSLETKRDWKKLVDYIVPTRLGTSLEDKIKQYALLLFKEFDCRDIARVDFRISAQNEIFFLEINPLPGLSPQYSDLVIMSRKHGLSYEDLIYKIVSCAFARYGLVFQEAPKNNYARA